MSKVTDKIVVIIGLILIVLLISLVTIYINKKNNDINDIGLVKNITTNEENNIVENNILENRIIVNNEIENNSVDTNKQTIVENNQLRNAKLRIGDYVDYKYDKTQEQYIIPPEQGGGENYNFTPSISEQDPNVKWRVLNIGEDGNIKLISELPVETFLRLYGEEGYNNGVRFINEACRKFYSNKELGIEARNLNLEDIEELLEYKIQRYKEPLIFNNTQKDIYYPNICKYEKMMGIDSNDINYNGLGVSEYSNDYISGYSKAEQSITIASNYYNISFASQKNIYNPILKEMLVNPYISPYWIASRYAFFDGFEVQFGIREVHGQNSGGVMLFTSNQTGSMLASDRLRPIVEIKGNLKIELCDGENSETNMHRIVKGE